MESICIACILAFVTIIIVNIVLPVHLADVLPSLPPSSLHPPFRSTLEYLFLELALTQPSLNEAEELAISFDLNIHELYQVVAQTKLERGDGEGALNIYLHSTVSSHMIVRGM